MDVHDGDKTEASEMEDQEFITSLRVLLSLNHILFSCRKLLGEQKRKLKSLLRMDIIRNCNNSEGKKRCLLIYIQEPFRAAVISKKHQNVWQSLELARIIGNLGYRVDVVDYRNSYARPIGKYDLVLGLIPRGIDIYSKHLRKDGKKVAYLTSSNLEFTNQSEQKRLDDLCHRRGVRLTAYRQSTRIDTDIEGFDGALFFGNKHNLKTYDCFKMPPVYYIANNGYDYSFPINFHKDPHKFIFFGSVGQVHKGLDLLLEIFSEEEFPCEIYICGSVGNETDFEKAYEKELYRTSNIHTMGMIDVDGEKFRRLVDECAYLILPSCAEGQAGSVVTLMAAGVIPICSKECGYDEDEVILLQDCDIETIRNCILVHSEKDQEWIAEKSQNAYNTYKTRHSMKNFSESVYNGLTKILGDKTIDGDKH